MTPDTAKRTAFEKYDGTDSRAIMNGKFFNVKYSSCLFLYTNNICRGIRNKIRFFVKQICIYEWMSRFSFFPEERRQFRLRDSSF